MSRPSLHLPTTRFLSVQDVAALVRQQGIAATLRGMLQAIEADFLRWPEFDKAARVASHSELGVIELMPVADARTYAFKYVNGHPSNHRLGLPTVNAFGALAEVRTGVPLLLSELTLTTALRTAAVSVMAARVLARPGSRRMALIGNGAQSEFQALAFHHLLGITELSLYDIDTRATARLVRHLEGTGLRIQVCDSVTQAVRGADIVTTVTADKSQATVLLPPHVAPGMHLNAVGGDCPGKTELHPDVVAGAATFVEYEPQTRIEGELQQMPADYRVTELWRVLRGEAPGRQHDAQVTLFDSVGFALEDFSALRYLQAAAERLGLGQPLDLVPELPDPKNLYGLVHPALPRVDRPVPLPETV